MSTYFFQSWHNILQQSLERSTSRNHFLNNSLMSGRRCNCSLLCSKVLNKEDAMLHIMQRVALTGLLIAFLSTTSIVNAQGIKGLTGSWIGTALSTTVPLPPLKTLMTFTSEGTVVESRRIY